MPEEHNRVLTDHAADLLLAPTQVAMGHLAREGLADRAVLVGDVMTDVLFRVRDSIVAKGTRPPLGLSPKEYYVATIHRPDNTDDPVRLRGIIDALSNLAHPVLLLVHPRLRALADEHAIPLEQGAVRTLAPLAYPELVSAVMQSAGIVTDSGGLQKEAFLLRVPCTTMRTETEWVETVETGWNALASDAETLLSAICRPLPPETEATPYGTGNTARQAVQAIVTSLS